MSSNVGLTTAHICGWMKSIYFLFYTFFFISGYAGSLLWQVRKTTPLCSCGVWASHCGGFSCGAWTQGLQQVRLLGSRAQAQELWPTGLVGLRHEGSSQIRDWTQVSCIGHRILYHWDTRETESESCSVMSDSLWPHGLYSPWNSPDQNTGVGSLSLLQGIFPTQESNPSLPHCRRILYQLSHKGSPRILEWAAYPFSRGSSRPSNQTGVSCIAGGFFTNWVMREALEWHCIQFRSEAQSCLTLCDPMDYSTPGFPVLHQLPELIQTHVHQVSDVIQSSHPLSSPSPPALNLFQHQGLFQWVSSLHQNIKVVEL